MPFKSFSAAGVAAIQAAVVDVNGYPRGITGTIATGAGAAFKLMKFTRRFGGKAPNPVQVYAAGDNNRNRHTYVFNSEQLPSLNFQFDAYDLDAHAAATSTLIAVSGNSNVAILAPNVPAAAAQLCVIANIDAQAADTGSFGLKKFINEIYPLVYVTPLYAEHDNAAKAQWEYAGTPTQTDHAPWGEAFTIATNGATRGVAMMLTSDYPVTMETFIGNSATTQYTLNYTPAGTSGSGYISVWKNGAVSTAFTVTTATKQVTFTTAPATNDVMVIRYEATDLLQA